MIFLVMFLSGLLSLEKAVDSYEAGCFDEALFSFEKIFEEQEEESERFQASFGIFSCLLALEAFDEAFIEAERLLLSLPPTFLTYQTCRNMVWGLDISPYRIFGMEEQKKYLKKREEQSKKEWEIFLTGKEENLVLLEGSFFRQEPDIFYLEGVKPNLEKCLQALWLIPFGEKFKEREWKILENVVSIIEKIESMPRGMLIEKQREFFKKGILDPVSFETIVVLLGDMELGFEGVKEAFKERKERLFFFYIKPLFALYQQFIYFKEMLDKIEGAQTTSEEMSVKRSFLNPALLPALPVIEGRDDVY